MPSPSLILLTKSSNLNKVECKFLSKGLPRTTINCSNLNKVECKLCFSVIIK